MATTIKRKIRALDIPPCKYGSSCYRKNPEHYKKFKHPDTGLTKKRKLNVADDSKVNSQKDVDNSKVNSQKNVVDDNKMNSKNKDTEIDEFFDPVNISQNDTCKELDDVDTVDHILQLMPKDFFDFWDFCSLLKKSNPEDAFLDFGYKLVGTYDLLAEKIPKHKKVDLTCHWRYFYDPPEFQTVIMKNGKQLFHIGYFRDDPLHVPDILASNCASVDCKLTLMGDNIFAAMNIELNKTMQSQNSKTTTLAKLQKQLQEYAAKKQYSLTNQTPKTKARQKKVVAKTFHGLGIVVPVVNNVGYRPLPDSESVIKNILKKIVDALTEEKRLECEASLDEIISNVQFANDEGDYGMGLEFGIDLFCYGHPYFHNHIISILSVAYELAKRPKYASIIRAHLKDRRKDSPLKSKI